jgi:hypothetical protein
MGMVYKINIINPENTAQTTCAVIPYDVYLNAYKFMPVVYENLRAAKYVLENPYRIFAGIRRFNDGGWCFTGRPDRWHIKESTMANFPDHLIFAVYLNPSLCVYEWRAEKADPDDPSSPEGWKDRYKALIWKHTS